MSTKILDLPGFGRKPLILIPLRISYCGREALDNVPAQKQVGGHPKRVLV